MGLSTRQRGFSDENLFMAMTTQSKVAGMNLNDCKRVKRKDVCKLYEQKWSYAIPLEIIYLTPLAKWNPYDIQYKGAPYSPFGRTVTAGNDFTMYHSRELFTGSLLIDHLNVLPVLNARPLRGSWVVATTIL